ncbi:MAG TPA: hypothetical protein VJB05_01280 [archaeon]|nr:hypothetical protein [archaeon]
MIEYILAFFAVIIINVVPFLMPPTWLVLGFFYTNFTFDVTLLAVVGAIASTIGRFILSHLGTYSRRFAGNKRKKDMDIIGKIAKRHPVKSFFVTFLFSLSPFPSNVYFITVGLARARIIPIFLGFFSGRLVSYYVLILTTRVIFNSINDVFSSKLLQVIVMDVAGIVFMLIFIMVDWSLLIQKRRLKLVPLKLPWKK